ncbi:iclR helix-turn-helix domain protein [Mycobacterium kansasii]|uniref:IclR helix-turn-helix domain protein n=1 Tax=Mycobacterium kansasii TaxID=1768 RepID=A0A1V3XT08_MYCKA|nr:iclR helix-turn-helix domain protein [Mycobacterium kansasii]
MAGNTSIPGITVTSRIMAVLSAFDEEHRSLTLTELAARARIPVPTAHRLIGELVVGGALHRRDDGHYVVGPLLWQAGLLAPVEGGLQYLAEPFMHDIYAATLATVHLAVRDGDEVLYIERMAAGLPCRSSVGRAAGCRCTRPAWARCCLPMRRRRSRQRCLPS